MHALQTLFEPARDNWNAARNLPYICLPFLFLLFLASLNSADDTVVVVVVVVCAAETASTPAAKRGGEIRGTTGRPRAPCVSRRLL